MQNEHFKNQDAFLKRLDDYRRFYEMSYRTSCSDFLTPSQVEVVKRYYGKQVDYHFVPDFEETTMRCLVVGDYDDVVCLIGKYRGDFVKISHRDVYGALMNLGIQKEKFGDIWLDDSQIVIYTKENIADYIEANLHQIHQLSIHFKRSDVLLEPVFKTKSLKITSSSYRLDAIVSELGHMSRNKAQQMIRAGLVRLNYDSLVDCNDLCHNGDIVSIRQVGRFKIREEIAITKKGNLLVHVEQYV